MSIDDWYYKEIVDKNLCPKFSKNQRKRLLTYKMNTISNNDIIELQKIADFHLDIVTPPIIKWTGYTKS